MPSGFKVEINEATGGPKETESTDGGKPKEKKREIITVETFNESLKLQAAGMTALQTSLMTG